jgi:hypothetical protein
MIPPLPEGARLALLHWPWGTPAIREIIEATMRAGYQRPSVYQEQAIINALLAGSLMEEIPVDVGSLRRFRLTQAGRRAVDAIQSGEAGQ